MKTTGLAMLVAFGVLSAPVLAERWFVRADLQGGANNGTSWSDAFTGTLGLQAALAAAAGGDEVWVAAGTYRPAMAGNRAAPFAPAAGVALYGGFAGNEASLQDRDWTRHLTVLSGDLNGDDGPSFANRADNSHHVVHITADGCVLDGFTVRGGMASDAAFPRGGGLRVDAIDDLLVRHCLFTDNEADHGGAVATLRGARFENCIFLANRAVLNILSSGGAIHTALQLTCEQQPVFINCLIAGNVSSQAGGLLADHSCFTLVNCTVAGNRATELNNGAGAAMHGTFGSLTITNSVLWGNEGAGGATELAQLWTPNAPGYLTLNRTCVQNYTGALQASGRGNFGNRPLFVDELGGDGLPGTGDEDLRPGAGSPLIDRGDNGALPEEVSTDLAGQPRRTDDPQTADTGTGTPPLVDVGAYEFSAGPVPAMSPIGLAACALLLAGAAGAVLRSRGPRQRR